jgi:hypothetical protein
MTTTTATATTTTDRLSTTARQAALTIVTSYSLQLPSSQPTSYK